MSKRNQQIKVCPQSKALLALRQKSGLGIRKLADRMNYSHTRVHQMESGRDEISEDYVRLFLKATGFTWEDWLIETKGGDSFNELRKRCHEALDAIDSNKLQLIYGVLTNI
jgi:transcriptional regulator with XRE-family HTH domain